MKKYYEILGLKEGATKQEIKKAYNKLSKELDPKKNNNEEFFVEETNKLKEAYDKLMNSSILSTKKVVDKSNKKKNISSNDISNDKISRSNFNKLLIIFFLFSLSRVGMEIKIFFILFFTIKFGILL